jgi:hypothetical protein
VTLLRRFEAEHVFGIRCWRPLIRGLHLPATLSMVPKRKANRGSRLTPEGLRPQQLQRGGRWGCNGWQHGTRYEALYHTHSRYLGEHANAIRLQASDMLFTRLLRCLWPGHTDRCFPICFTLVPPLHCKIRSCSVARYSIPSAMMLLLLLVQCMKCWISWKERVLQSPRHASRAPSQEVWHWVPNLIRW